MEWRYFDIEDYGTLKVSEYGDIYGMIDPKDGMMDFSKKRKCSTDKDGYFRVSVTYRSPHYNDNGELIGSSKMFVYRIVAKCFIPNPNNLPVVNHIDGNPQNNHYSNLEWCTIKYNHEHALRIGLEKGIDGEKNPHCKLKENDIYKIREDYEKSNLKGYAFYRLYAKKYGVSDESIRNIVKRITWTKI